MVWLAADLCANPGPRQPALVVALVALAAFAQFELPQLARSATTRASFIRIDPVPVGRPSIGRVLRGSFAAALVPAAAVHATGPDCRAPNASGRKDFPATGLDLDLGCRPGRAAPGQLVLAHAQE